MSKELNLSINLAPATQKEASQISMSVNWKFILPVVMISALAFFFFIGYTFSALAVSGLLAVWLISAWIRHLRSFDMELDLSDLDKVDCVREMRLFE